MNYYTFRTPKEVYEWAKNNYTDYNICNKELYDFIPLISDYKADSQYINNYVRNGNRTKEMQEMQVFIKRHKTDKSIIVTRFVTPKEYLQILKNTLFNDLYIYPNFLSTTLLEACNKHSYKNHRIKITINIPLGTAGIFLPEINKKNPEFELLLPYDIKIKKLGFLLYEIIPEE